MSIWKILIDFCLIGQKIKIKITFADIVYNIFVMKKSFKNLKSLFEN